jgi:hypothetical protein
VDRAEELRLIADFVARGEVKRLPTRFSVEVDALSPAEQHQRVVEFRVKTYTPAQLKALLWGRLRPPA